MELTEKEKEQLKIDKALWEFYNYLDEQDISLNDIDEKEYIKK